MQNTPFSGRSEAIRAGIRSLARRTKRGRALRVMKAVLLLVHEENAEKSASFLSHEFEDVVSTTCTPTSGAASALRYSCLMAMPFASAPFKAARQAGRWNTQGSSFRDSHDSFQGKATEKWQRKLGGRRAFLAFKRGMPVPVCIGSALIFIINGYARSLHDSSCDPGSHESISLDFLEQDMKY